MKNLELSDIRTGNPQPLGATSHEGGVNFAFHSRDASAVILEFFDRPQDATAARRITLDPITNRTDDVWHVWVKGIREGQLYAVRMVGPYNPQAGHRFNVKKLLLDPFAKVISKKPVMDFVKALGLDFSVYTNDVSSFIDNAASQPKCIFTEGLFDWKKDTPPRHPWDKVVIYETHVRGFSMHTSSGVRHPGTYRGLIEKVPYFQKLGVTTVELMPVFEFNEHQSRRFYTDTLLPIKNYWGYDPVLFFAPKASYSSLEDLTGPIKEFKEMVAAFHKAGLEIILDVVFNHTAEGEELGPTLSWRGMDNTSFYMLEQDKRFYKNFSGCGNTFNANHPLAQEVILSALRYWVQEMHVDGFRFDLATCLSRDSQGLIVEHAPILEKIITDPVLREVKLIAEPWDAVGGYQLGRFSTRRWAEWNDQYRDDLRRFWRGDEGSLGAFASRLCGSGDIFGPHGKGAHNSINFVTSHDGFTLNDLVSYKSKHNLANGQNNRDGADENYSDNYGVEGDTQDAVLKALRKRQIKNFLLSLFVSRGVPMLNGGDELSRTQQGNNNAYAQDNEISWYDWRLLEKNEDIFNFVGTMINFRRAHPVLSQNQFYTKADIQWFNPQGESPGWNAWEKQLGCLIHEGNKGHLYFMFNASLEKASFRLPSLPSDRGWKAFIDTSGEAKAPTVADQQVYEVNSRTSVILLG